VPTHSDGSRPQPLAAWDFDGTISRRDTLGGFLSFVAGRPRLLRSGLVQLPSLIRGIGHGPERDAAKERLVGAVLRDRHDAELQAAGRRYAEILETKLRPESLERIVWHRQQGHRQVIVSASLRYYLEPIAEHLGIDHVIGVRLELDDSGRVTGRLDGANVRGDEKALRLRAWLSEVDGPEVGMPEIWAYGNSTGDAAMLAMADHPTLFS
jgi:HAD superfamily hydrolase (TIGR01490 family)